MYVETYMNVYGLHKKADISMCTVWAKKKEVMVIGSNAAQVKMQFLKIPFWKTIFLRFHAVASTFKDPIDVSITTIGLILPKQGWLEAIRHKSKCISKLNFVL